MCNSCLVRNLNSCIYLLCSTFLLPYFNTECSLFLQSTPLKVPVHKIPFLLHDLPLRAVNHFRFVRTIRRLVPICVLVHCADFCCVSRADSCRHFQYTINFVKLFPKEYMFRSVVYYRLKQNQLLGNLHLLMFSGV